MGIELNLRTQALARGDDARSFWAVQEAAESWPCQRTALLLCDVWDKHWCRGATERLEVMIPRMNQVVAAARRGGVQIVHAPSDTLDFYADSPARQRVAQAARVEPPAALVREEPPLPIDDSDGGSDTGEAESFRACRRQHPGIEIDEQRDGIGDDGGEIYSFLAGRGIDHLLIMGVHTNMCVLGRSFAIKQMVGWGLKVALVRDLTDAMYNPAKAPYVSHEAGTQLVVEYIEKFWCPTVASEEILAQ